MPRAPPPAAPWPWRASPSLCTGPRRLQRRLCHPLLQEPPLGLALLFFSPWVATLPPIQGGPSCPRLSSASSASRCRPWRCCPGLCTVTGQGR
eukprot:3707250-Pyramimonas_sp.AAC.1